MMTKVLSFALIAFHAAQVSAFAPSSAGSSCRSIGRLCMADDAQALSDYMAKSHEEKLRAVKDIEDKKNSEIAALKAEIQELKSNSALPAATSAAPLSNASASDAELKLASYQKFMEDYIVNAQTQKLMAVKEAELKAEKKFQERLEKLLAASGVALPASSGDVGAPELSLYQKRNLKVAAAGEAGKSRWGSMEVQKAIENAKSQPAVVTPKQAVEESSVFDQRNARILAAAAAGKSRWGDMELQRAKNSGITSATSVAAAPAPANTVVTLEDRVNLGARLLGV